MISHLDSPDFKPNVTNYRTIGYYIVELSDYEPDNPIGFRENLLEAEALRHFVAENRCDRVRWYTSQEPYLDIISFDITPVQVPI